MSDYTIVYFSGTGGTKLIAETFLKQLDNKSEIFSLDEPLPVLEIQNSLNRTKNLILLFPIHAFSAPQPVHNWIDQLSVYKEDIINAVVISVSGGGEIWPNTGCRKESITKLEKKNINVIEDQMMVMPSNWLIETNEDVSKWLILSIPKKVKQIIDALAQETHESKMHRKQGIIQQKIGSVEKRYAHKFPQSIRITEACNLCGWCVKSCPTNNISFGCEENDSPILFSNHCIMCFRCVYGCPNKAMITKDFQVLKSGYSIKEYSRKSEMNRLQPIRSCSKGLIWLGVRRYLLDLYDNDDENK